MAMRSTAIAVVTFLISLAWVGEPPAQSRFELEATPARLSQEPCDVPDNSSAITGAGAQPNEASQTEQGAAEPGKTSVEIEIERDGNEINWKYSAQGRRKWLIMSATVGSNQWSDTRKLPSYETKGNVAVPRSVGVNFSAVVDDSQWDYGGGIRIEVSGYLEPGEASARAGCSL